jgi:hypothetical protein
MRKYLVTFFVLFIVSTASAKEYGHYDPQRLLITSETPEGRTSAFNVTYLKQILDDLFLHAKNYPPHFDTLQDRQRATRDAELLSQMLDVMTDSPTATPQILLSAALVNHIGHNLDISGAADKASSIFQRILKVSPSDPKAWTIFKLRQAVFKKALHTYDQHT